MNGQPIGQPFRGHEELERSQSQLQQTQTELERSQSQLQQTQTELERSQSQLQYLVRFEHYYD
ncbi:hypothetical protein [Anabaena sp. YBS01]|uniref:hypothetical protein n=1 Tax=Anabaena sp. YBS01 TaxID=2490939 RepID=UPI001292FDE9|nr:hypothetical protein [Anabaena sp. YBS01]QFZ15704.1 hypothetical protein EH233_29315 [Anabaena sp. YBS01]